MDTFRITTLIDITETGARRADDPFGYRQQQNFLTVLQTIGLRTNMEYHTSPKVVTGTTKQKQLGSAYEGTQTFWQFDFDIVAEGSLNVDMLNTDFNLIPIIVDLAETSKFKNNVFSTQNSKISNINFTLLDK